MARPCSADGDSAVEGILDADGVIAYQIGWQVRCPVVGYFQRRRPPTTWHSKVALTNWTRSPLG